MVRGLINIKMERSMLGSGSRTQRKVNLKCTRVGKRSLRLRISKITSRLLRKRTKMKKLNCKLKLQQLRILEGCTLVVLVVLFVNQLN
jgi:hypothetical protein